MNISSKSLPMSSKNYKNIRKDWISFPMNEPNIKTKQ